MIAKEMATAQRRLDCHSVDGRKMNNELRSARETVSTAMPPNRTLSADALWMHVTAALLEQGAV